LKLKCDEPLSNVAFTFNVRRYTEEAAEVYRMVLAMKTNDAASQAVAANNLAAAVGARGKGGGDALKRVEKMASVNGRD
jgi:acetylglutamate kinase